MSGLVDHLGRPIKAVELADRLIRSAYDEPWKVVDMIVQSWAKNFPEESQGFYEAMKSTRKTRKNDYGVMDNVGSKEMTGMRYLAEIPGPIYDLIDKVLYKTIEDMGGNGKHFWREFLRRYPAFKASENAEKKISHISD